MNQIGRTKDEFMIKKRNEQATTISVVKTHFLVKIVARSC